MPAWVIPSVVVTTQFSKPAAQTFISAVRALRPQADVARVGYDPQVGCFLFFRNVYSGLLRFARDLRPEQKLGPVFQSLGVLFPKGMTFSNSFSSVSISSLRQHYCPLFGPPGRPHLNSIANQNSSTRTVSQMNLSVRVWNQSFQPSVYIERVYCIYFFIWEMNVKDI